VDRARRKRARGGGRSSGELGFVARGHGEVREVMLRPPGDAVSAVDMVVWPLDGRSIVGGELGGGACGEASCGRYGAREREREGGKGCWAHDGCSGLDGEVGDELLQR
jgi:hypothetical protein